MLSRPHIDLVAWSRLASNSASSSGIHSNRTTAAEEAGIVDKADFNFGSRPS
jgi:hypothetical protein